MDATPDNTDNLAVMSSLIGDDVDNGDLDPIVAEAIARKYNLADLGYTSGYNYGLRDVEVIPLDNSNGSIGITLSNIYTLVPLYIASLSKLEPSFT